MDWKQIKEFPDYEVSPSGQFRRKNGGQGAAIGKIIKWHTCTSSRYPTIRFCVNGKQFTRTVHSVVAKTFFGEKPEGMQIRHLDGNKTNNNVYNLCYGTAKENGQDKVRHGNSAKGEKNKKSKLNNDQVLEIRRLQGIKKSAEVAKDFNISVCNIYRIWNQKYWKHI